MARSTCPKCESSRFEVVENSPSRSNFKLMFIQCSSCGAVVGVTDFYNIGHQNKEIEKEIESLAKLVKHNQYLLDQIANRLNHM